MNEQINMEAWRCLDQALFTSSHVVEGDIEQGRTVLENVYPVSKDETDRMESLVNEAERKVEDSTETAFRDRVRELREIISYSKTRHRTWKLSLILGSIIATCIFWYFGNQDQERVERYSKDVELVKKWQKQDTTITYASIKANAEENYNYYSRRLSSANAYKFERLHYFKGQAESCLKAEREFRQKADTASVEKRKEACLRQADTFKGYAKKHRTEFDEIAKLDFDGIQKLALKDAQLDVDMAQEDASSKRVWMVYLIILIPLYIISGYPYGYMITAHRTQHGFMRGVRKTGFAIASFFFGSGLLMSLLPDDIVRYRYADGHTETRKEVNPTNFGIVAMKFGLMVLGVLIFCFVSVFIMTIETVTGLKRNFDWVAIFGKISKKENSQVLNESK